MNFKNIFKRNKKDEYVNYQIERLDKFIVNLLKFPISEFVLQQEESGFHLPEDFKNDPAGWLVVLNKIKFAFDQKFLLINNMENKVTKNMTAVQLEENRKKIKEGFELFGKYLEDLYEENYGL